MNIQSEEIETCHRSGKTERKTKCKRTIIRFVNRKHCKKALLNKKKLSNINNNKFSFNAETKVYINENLTPMNESITFNCRKPKRSNIIHACYARERIVHIKQEQSSSHLQFSTYLSCISFFLILVLLMMRRGMLTPLFSQLID